MATSGQAPGDRVETLVDILQKRAAEGSDRLAYTFLADGERDLHHSTWGDLDRRARTIGAFLHRAAAVGDRALLLYPPGLEFIAAFLGCLYAGVVAVPAYPPGSRRQLPRLATMVRDARPAVVLTTADRIVRFERLAERLAELRSLRWCSTDDLPADLGADWRGPDLTRDQLAFLQYTSGSTSSPRGVMIRHGHLVYNEEMIRRAFDQSRDSVVVGWLPVYHDMGLIGNVLQPLYVGARCVLMAPMHFLQRPRRWLEAISRFRATTSGGPNFAYDLCVRKIPSRDREGLDLSTWRVAFNGAEPVRAETLERFGRAFEPCGFRRRAFFPCYGLAEATLLVSGIQPDEPPRSLSVEADALERGEVKTVPEGRRLVACGRSPLGQQVRIVSPDTREPCPDGRVGEIWVAGESVAEGYWRQPDASRETFAGRLAGVAEGSFLRTGDLGFVEGDELFVTGRLKDLIILRGRNLYPQDLERSAEGAHRALRPEGTAAFAVDAETGEQPVVVCEVERRREAEAGEAARAVGRALAEEHAVRVREVVVVRAGSVPKTSSGKVRRQDCRKAWAAGELHVLATAAPDAGPDAGDQDALESAGTAGSETLDRESLRSLPPAARQETLLEDLAREVARAAGVDRGEVNPDRPLVGLGLDSLAAVELQHRLETAWDVTLPISLFLGDGGLQDLAAELLRRVLADPADAAPRLAARGPSEGEHPASPGQQALWFLQRLAPHSAAYNLSAAARVRGAFDLRALEGALRSLAARHPALRTIFRNAGGEPRQRVAAAPDVELVTLPEGLGRDEARERLADEVWRPFDLERGPLLRVAHARLGPAEHRLALAIHHSVTDFWSMALLVRELAELYGERTAGTPAPALAPAPPPELRFSDWVRWRDECLRSGERDGVAWRFWRDRLAGVPQALELPTDRPRPARQTFAGSRVRLFLAPQARTGFESLAAAGGTTLLTVLLAAFEALLHRTSGQPRFLVGTPTSGRSHSGVAGVMGYFVNLLALPVDFSGRPTAGQHLERTRRETLSAFEHGDYPFPLLSSRLEADRDPGRSPLFQTVFVLQQARSSKDAALAAFALGWPGAELAFGDLVLESLPLETRWTPFELTLMAAEIDGGLGFSLEFNSDLYDAATARRMLEHLRTLLAGMVAEPGRAVGDLPWLTPPERAQLVREWSDRRHELPAPTSLPGLFQARVQDAPDAVALMTGEGAGHLSYGELRRRAVRLARRLRRLGVGPEVPVATFIERSPEAVLAMLAILEAGGAYVPLDPAYPAARLKIMIEDCRAPAVLTTPELAPRLPKSAAWVLRLGPGGVPVAPEGERGITTTLAAGDDRRSAHPAGLAYVMYTSGSTGRPKGVQVPHQAVIRLVHSSRYVELGPRERLALASNLSFDAATFELWGALLHGASLVIFPPRRSSLGELGDLVARHRVTTLWLTAGLFHQMVEDGSASLRSVRQLLAGGEAVSAEHVRRLLRELPGIAVVNGYGPTENTTFTCCNRVRDPAAVGATFAIGRPISNTTVRLLDRRGRPVPIGVAGELTTGGLGLARAYLRRPRQTAEAFVPAAGSRRPGERAYRTGDLARYLGDGRIEFMGRFDHQVKLRGFRVELGEVDSALLSHAAVATAATLVREDRAGDRRLVAYVTPATVAIDALRSHLAARLPEAMLPAAIVALGELPLTAHGKLDRARLPAPDWSESAAAPAPSGPTEELVAAIYAGVLGLGEARTDHDFFELGGHSLLATRAVSKIREVFGVELPLQTFFESPTVAGLAGRIDAERRATGTPPAPPIVAVPRPSGDEPGLPLSFAQQRLWFLDQFEPESPFYNVPAALELRGELDRRALARGFTEIVCRHEALRTTFRPRQGLPEQVIHSASSTVCEGGQLPVWDLSRLPGRERDAELDRRVRAEATRPFDLGRGPLMRTVLLRLGPRRHVLLVALHHIVSDGWSLGVLIDELHRLYGAWRDGGPSPLAPLPVQYADFAVWQRRRLAGEAESLLARWRRRLAGAPALELPADRPRPAAMSFRGRTDRFRVPGTVLAALHQVGRKHHSTLFMTLLAAFGVLLHRLAGQDDLCVGTPVANRRRTEVEKLIGFFANTLVLRLDLAGDPTWLDLLARVRTVALDAFSDQDLPFERLVEELEPERELGRTPLFQVLFVLQNAPLGALDLPGLEARPLTIETGTSKFDLSISLNEDADGLAAAVEYSRDLFDTATVLRWWRHYVHLLASVAATAKDGSRISRLEHLTPAQRHQVLAEWGTGTPAKAEDPAEGTVHRLFEARAARTPEAVAVVLPGEPLATGEGRPSTALTYRALDVHADRLASRLRSLGAGPDRRVGLCLERSLEMAIAVLATLKAGAAYVPLDPGYPESRLDLMLSDSEPAVLVVDPETSSRLRWSGPVLSPAAHQLRDEAARKRDVRPEPDASAGNLAYMIYTSGSTGRPKGVAMPHAVLRDLVSWQRGASSAGPGTRTAQFASLSFDVAFQEMFSTWATGGTLVLVRESQRRDPEALRDLCERAVIERLFLPPVALQHLAEATPPRPGRSPLSAVQEILTAGEQLLVTPAVERLLTALPRGRLENQYGPAECHVVTFYRVAGEAAPPIGRPIAGAVARVLDGGLRPAAPGVAGELYLGGGSGGRGYHGRPAWTAERFLPDPYSQRPGHRLYRTGDRARTTPEGNLVFLGRADHQLKLRGFRVEPGEIEAALAGHPHLQAAAVTVAEDGGGRRLVAWLETVEGATAPAVSELRELLAKTLPDYMVPSAFAVLDGLPLTPSGKIDRRSLAAREIQPSAPAPSTSVPASWSEELLTGVWCEVLGLREVDRDADFFALGGHSLLATRVVARARSAFGVELPVRELFEAPTIRRLAARLEARRAGAVAQPPPRPRPRIPGEELPLSPAQDRLWFLDRFEPGNAALNLFVPLRLRGELVPAALHAALDAVVRRHESLRTALDERGGRPYQRIEPPAPTALPQVDLRAVRGDRHRRLEALLASEATRPFELDRAPLWRARLLCLGEDEHVLALAMHHVISDGWSIKVLLDELSALYAHALRRPGEPSPLEPLPIQYADHARWQRERLSGDAGRDDLAYWRSRLDGAPEILELPTDRPRPAVQSFRGGRISSTLEDSLEDSLRALGRRYGATLFMVLLTVFKLLLHRLSGQRDVVVGTPVAGRDRKESEGLIGFFLNTLVLRTDVSRRDAAHSLAALLARVRETVLDAFTHQDLPFESVLDELQPRRDLSRTPLFQVFFNMLSLPWDELEMPGLELELLEVPEVLSKFDLTLYVREHGRAVILDLVYNAELFDAPRMAELLSQYEHLLRQTVRTPERDVESFDLLTASARSSLPPTSAGLDAGWRGAVHELFASHAREHPDRVAVSDPRDTWTYGRLEELSRRLALALVRHGVARGDRVVIHTDRRAALVAAILGTLRARAAFVILDAAYPAPRLAAIVRRAQPRARLVVHGAAPPPELAEALAGLPAVRLDEVATDPSLAAARLPDTTVGPDDLAYVAFTSGSTGEPKGILGRHGSLTHFLPWLRREFDLRGDDVYSQLSGLAHDPLHRDVFTPLSTGASVAVPDPAVFEGDGRLATWIARRRVTVAHLTPALGQLVTSGAGREAALPSLRRVFFVGDVLIRRDVERLGRLAPRLRCINYYGSTESQRAVGFHRVSTGDRRRREVLPLGRGIEDVQLWVVGAAGCLAGIGEVGEIYFRSPHLALGYLGDPALTAERFVPCPGGERLYRTGDLGRYLPDGEIEFAGRADTQVQVRGFRVELGEIEAVLGRHPGVREAAVVAARVHGRGEPRLTAWWVPGGEPASAGELREYLRRRLPEFMVPPFLAPLEALPLTPNGKLQRRELIRRAEAEAPSATTSATLESPEEELVAGIWSEVLGVGRERLHGDSDFFELGGHSLVATRVLSRLRDAFGFELRLVQLFSAPTVAGLAAELRRARTGSTGARPPLRPRPRRGALPLSFAQERLWFLEQLTPGGSAYNVPCAARLLGRFEPAILAAALDEVVQRHEVLSSRFASRDGRPFRTVAPPSSTPLPMVDLSGLTAGRRARLDALATDHARRPFDLETGSPIRALAVRLAREEHAVLVTLHHIVSDGWSTGLLIRELGALYGALAARHPSPLPPLPVQYADYAAWQREVLAGDGSAAELDYWRRQLEGLASPAELTSDRPRPARRSERGGRVPVTLGKDLMEAIDGLARRFDATSFMVLVAALETLLGRLTSSPDVAVGSPIAGRGQVETEELIGFFVNTLVLRTDLGGDPAFGELLGRVRTVTLGAYAHAELPFERLVEALQPDRDLSRSPLFQVLFVFQNVPFGSLELPGLRLEPLEVDTGTTKFDLVLNLAERRGSLAGHLVYHRDLFDATTVRRLARQLETLLRGAVAAPDEKLSGLALMTRGERHQLEVDWDDTSGPLLPGGGFLRLVDEQLARRPDAVAVELDDHRLSFGELDRRADRLARFLAGCGAGPEATVGILMERSLELMVALVAVLRAGSAYVPLDPRAPEARLRFVVTDAGCRMVLTQSRLGGRVSAAGIEEIVLDGDGRLPSPATRPPAASHAAAPADRLVCLIYTSGTTGRPKGVMTCHGAITNQLLWMRRAYGFDASDVVLQRTPIIWDVAIWELFLPLLVGARLVLARPGGHGDTAYLAEVIRERRVTTVHFVPSMLRVFLDDADLRQARHLRRWITSGEPLSRSLERRSLAALPGELHHMYGPSESPRACHNRRRGDDDQEIAPIGRATANVRLRLLDRRLEAVPIGVPGEITLGGLTLARGYHRRPALTAERFIPDPRGRAGGRLYRTGDLARRLPDGRLRFLGRHDHQVKLRGVRIELGEIEATFEEHPAIHEAAAILCRPVAGPPFLAVFLETRGEAPDPGALRAFLAHRLPDPMIPAHWEIVDALPRTLNDKVDRMALARHAPASPRGPEAPAQARPPRTPEEELVAEIWTEVLGTPPGIDDNFFELGGHSLLATRVTSRLRAVFGAELPLARFFELPTVAGLAAELAAERTAGRPPAPPVGPRPRHGDLPLSFAQERLWFLDQLEPGSTYNVPAAFELEGALDVPALATSFGEIVRRHEVLRTRFPSRDGRPEQRVEPAAVPPLPTLDLTALPAARRTGTLADLAAAEARRPFDLEHGPLVRALLIRLAPGREGAERPCHVVVATLHHVVSDGWSTGLLIRELGTLYRAFAARRPSPLPELEVQYADFALWQRDWLRGEVLESQLDFWRRRLAGSPATLELPADRPRPAVASGRGGRVRWQLDADRTDAMQAFSRTARGTLFMTLLAAFQSVLARYSGQGDVVVGSPIAGRHRAEIENLIGFFVNTLALRGDLGDDPTFSGLLRTTRERTLEAYAHQDLPFERLVDELGIPRELSHTPLFQVLFVLQNVPARTLELPGLELRPLTLETGTTKFDLTLSLGLRDGRLAGYFEFARDLFDLTTVARLCRSLESLLTAAVADPERRISQLSLSSPAEHHQLLAEWNDVRSPSDGAEPVHRFVARQARALPDAVAVEGPAALLTYGALVTSARRLAAGLRSLGVAPDSVVGICLERGPDMVVAVLATLEAGGAYLPLDPAYPRERLALMVADAEPAVILTQCSLDGSVRGALPADRPCPILHLDGPPTRTEPTPAGAPARPGNLAYLIYTSGSTGRPKGIAMPHATLANLVAWQVSTSAAGAGTRTSQFTSLSFDVAFQEIFTTWASGGTLVLVDEDRRRDPAALFDLLASRRVERLFLPPVALGQLAEASPGPAVDSLREIVTAGEQLVLTPPIRRFLAHRPRCRLLNHYGPAECHVVTEHPVREARITNATASRAVPVAPPIGRPIADARVYVLSSTLERLPPGVVGELYLGGRGVSRGYLRRPRRTAERFLPDPLSAAPGHRMYRSGDLARWRFPGELDFQGRADQQVKLRGYRIEPGEIEAQLGRHPRIRSAAVALSGSGPGARLVAYVVADGEKTPDAAELRDTLARKLPDYMVPSAFVRLDALPLTPTGKVDRKALPAVEDGGDAQAGGPPATPAEELLATLWSEVLERRVEGVEEDFFGLGGHSLLATRVAARASRAFGVDLPVREIFEAPTVRRLARRLEEIRDAGAPSLVEISTAGRPADGELPLSPGQERMWFLDRLEPGNVAFIMPTALRLRGELDVPALERALDGVVARHETLRTSFGERDGRPFQRVETSVDLAWARVDLSALGPFVRPAELERRLRCERRRPFDLERAPLLRPCLVRLAAREHVLVLSIHHIVFDGWSTWVLLRELSRLYAAFRGLPGAPDGLPPPPRVQYADFARWQRELLAGGAGAAQVATWRERLAGAPARLELPADRPRPAVQSFAGARLTAALGDELSRELRALSRHHGVTLFMTLLALFKLLVARLSGERDVVIGTPIAGRGRQETENLIGFFLNTLVLRTGLASAPDGELRLEDLLKRVRRTVLEAFSHQDVPFEWLLEELKPPRDLSRTPLFQIFFNMLSPPAENVEMPGLELDFLTQPEVRSKFDLTLYAWDREPEIGLELVYDTALFSERRMREMLAQYRHLLAQAVTARPNTALDGFELATVSARQILPATSRELPATWPGPVHELIVDRARQHPGRIALVDGDDLWRYEDLEWASRQLALALVERGTSRGDRVLIYAHRGAPLVAALLAVLRAGAAFVLLDPAYPASRLAAIARPARARAWMTLEGAGEPPRELCEVLAGRPRLALRLATRDEPTAAAPAARHLESPRLGPHDVAYLAFTSGSTGEPKGILGSHASLTHLPSWQGRRFGIGPSDRFTLLSGLAHDPLLRDVFVPLVLGAPLAIPGREELAYAGRLAGWFERRQITVTHLTPAMARLLCAPAAGEPARLDTLRYAFFGGDVLHGRDVERLARLAPSVRCVNLYGTTETQRALACHPVPAGPAAAPHAGPLPLGRGVGSVQLLVADARGRTAGIGELGEIHVRSPFLALGYLGDPALTARRFLPDGSTRQAGGRVYRTGDLGRFLPDGEVELAGRADGQLQIRGFRVEPGEIESALRRHPEVADAAVVARPRTPAGDPPDLHLAAWLVPAGDRAPPADALRAFLRPLLPEYMLPAVFVPLDVLPLTPNGKVDRRALAGRDLPRTDAADRAAEARTPVEDILAGIWAEVLGAGEPGLDDDFFELGGHSLLVARVMVRLRSTFGLDLPLRTLFEAPTLRAFARRVDEARSAGTAEPDSTATIVIAATFPAEPVAVAAGFWLEELGLEGRVELTRDPRLLPDLLDPASRLGRPGEGGLEALLLGLEDGPFSSPATTDVEALELDLERRLRPLKAAIRDLARRSKRPILVLPCRPPATVTTEPASAGIFARARTELAAELRRIPGVEVVPPEILAELYPVAEDSAESSGDSPAPYPAAYLTSLGTMIARRHYAHSVPPPRAIVLAGDRTLWRGRCGVDPPAALETGPGRRALHELVLAHHRSGTALCLCGDHDEADVLRVFESGPEMPLRREHLAAWRLDGRPRPEHLRSLAHELGLELEDLVYVDGDTEICAEVEEACPDVMTLQLPREDGEIPAFLRHVWALDPPGG